MDIRLLAALYLESYELGKQILVLEWKLETALLASTLRKQRIAGRRRATSIISSTALCPTFEYKTLYVHSNLRK
jgi:hypothetical protein